MAGESPDLFRVLISTDNHLGYLIANETRGKDSFLAFEEVLETARRLKVDFLLLGGDLFHEHSPSNDTLHLTMKMLNQYCLGSYAIQFATDDSWLAPNYLNENLSVSLPIFIIHGNHDEPSVHSNVSALDLVAISHFINYFGKPSFQGETLTVKPIRLRKGRTTLLLYGIGHMKDEQLHRLFRQGLVKCEPPEEGAFSILLLHQNRFKGNSASAPAKNCILDTMIPDFIHLVVWGHEHDCFTQIRQPEGKEFHIYQPGSSVATSLTEGEAIPKHMGLLEVKCEGYRLTPIPYTAIRPLIYLQADLHDSDFSTSIQAEKHLTDLIEEGLRTVKPSSKGELALPLVRLKVNVDEGDLVNPIRINTKFAGRVANQDIVLVHKRAEKSLARAGVCEVDIPRPEQSGTQFIIHLLQEELETHRNEFKRSCVESLVEKLVSVIEDKDLRAMEGYFQEVQERGAVGEDRGELKPERQQTLPDLFSSGRSPEDVSAIGQKRLRDVTPSITSPTRQRLKSLSSDPRCPF